MGQSACTACGTVFDCPKCDGLEEDLRLIELERRKERRALARIEAKVKRDKEDVPERRTIEAYHREWVSASGRNPKRTKLTQDRIEAWLKLIRDGRSPDDIRAAIRGVGRYPYVVDGVRRREGPAALKYDDPTTLAKSGRTFERLADLGGEHA